jgi:hypothetical protein
MGRDMLARSKETASAPFFVTLRFRAHECRTHQLILILFISSFEITAHLLRRGGCLERLKFRPLHKTKEWLEIIELSYLTQKKGRQGTFWLRK